MRVIRVAAARATPAARVRRASVWLAILVLPAAALALVVATPPAWRPLGGVALAAGLTVGVALLVNELREHGRPNRDVERLLAPIFGDEYALIVGLQMPATRGELAALLVGPAGVRALLARRWEHRFRVRGRAWEVGAGADQGWVPFAENPSFDALALREAVEQWIAVTSGEPGIPIAATIVFPRAGSRVILQEPDVEIVTRDNAPWWAQRIGRVQRLDAFRAARLVDALLTAARADARARLPLQGEAVAPPRG
ncbi:MAG: hypothetical protein M3Y88_06320 [Chloroflexota bacterium]|nr:hypothetical protein [Chloroflexota bacterium]